MLPERLSRLLTAFVDGELNVRQRKAASRLLRKSSEARKLYRKMKGDARILARLPQRKLKVDLAATIMDKITLPDFALPTQPRRTLLPLRRVLAAAAILCAVGLGSYLYFTHPSAGLDDGSGLVQDTNAPAGPQAGQLGAEKSTLDLEPARLNPNAIFAFPNLKVPQFRQAQVRVPSIAWLGEFDSAAADQLSTDLRQDAASRLDIFGADPTRDLDRLVAAAKAQGIAVKIDRAAQEQLGRKAKEPLALYMEDVTPDEVARLVKQLAADEKKQGAPRFQQVVADRVSAQDLAGILGGDEDEYVPPSQRPLEDATAAEIIGALPRQSVAKGNERALIVVPYRTPQEVPYDEIQNLLDGKRTQRPGTIQLLIVLWSNP